MRLPDVPDPGRAADCLRAFRATGLLADFNAAGVLTAGEVHLATRLGALFGEYDEPVLLACALAARAPRLGHVCVDLAAVARTASVDVDAPVPMDEMPWPDPVEWEDRVAESPLAGPAVADGQIRPLRTDGSLVYLQRALDDELLVAEQVLLRARTPVPPVDEIRLAAGLTRVFGDGSDRLPRLAAERAVRGHVAVISGGPGTGKTTTVAKVLGLVCEQAASAGRGLPLIAVTAPTGKAAGRLGEAIAIQAAGLPVSPEIRAVLGGLAGTTLHRLLGVRATGVTYDREAPLPHDVVVVDEASMVSLALMARLLAAMREDARLILVGDAGQLASVEAGAVLGDIVGPIAHGVATGPLAGCITVLRTVHRFGAEIAVLADAVRDGDDETAMAVLRAGGPGVRWIDRASAARGEGPVGQVAVASWRPVYAASRVGNVPAALAAAGAFRVLCAHRRGPSGVAAWTARIERWLGAAIDGYSPTPQWYIGRPVLVTENDAGIGLFNGDSGVVVAGADARARVAFARGAEVVEISPFRLGAAETVYAMTIHKSQGSQFGTVAIVVPNAESRLLTRELLYTGITRARTSLIVIGDEDAIRDAIRRPIARASGLRERLWGPRQPERLSGSVQA